MKTVIIAIAIALLSFLGISANAQDVRAHVVVGAPIPGGHVVVHAGSPHYYHHHYYRYHYVHPYYGYRRYYYYHDYDRVWIPGYWDWDGDWIPGHWEWR